MWSWNLKNNNEKKVSEHIKIDAPNDVLEKLGTVESNMYLTKVTNIIKLSSQL
jgi:hypothetical protein